MNNKLITVAAIALTSALSATGVSAHVSGGGLVGGFGNVVSSSYTDCVRVSSGINSESCGHAKAVVKAAPKAVPKAVSQAVSLSGDATFATNSAELNTSGKAALDLFASRAKQLNVSGVAVVGHADSRGDATYNQGLSERRANSVKTYLEGKGVLGSLIRAEGEGENSPVATNATKEGRAANRRVDITVRGYSK
ncbi:MAG: OOP family OmpA-OmpF porin [Granulosicoccus sp.]|jgi:OOP family OmpA-OmpF porin